MKVSLILAHPREGSFNHAIATAAVVNLGANGHHVFFHDLYKENFGPALPAGEMDKGTSLPNEIEKHCKELAQADGIIIVHPNWWGQPPAITVRISQLQENLSASVSATSLFSCLSPIPAFFGRKKHISNICFTRELIFQDTPPWRSSE